MPELPEVELVARSLDKIICKRKIVSAELLRQRLAPDSEPSVFADKLNGAIINFVHRRGKHILFNLDNELTLITHLRMSGRFMLLPATGVNPKFTHAVFYFKDESRLVFQDQRHFGLMKIVETRHLMEAKELKKLAPEPFSEDFTPMYLRNKLLASKRSLKEFVIDQTKVCGLGNIYASEAMFLARVNPKTPSHKLSKLKSAALFQQIREVLSVAIETGSTLNVDPENIDGSYNNGDYEKVWQVYGREKMPCPRCHASIIRLKQAGRSTYFCPKCQKR